SESAVRRCGVERRALRRLNSARRSMSMLTRVWKLPVLGVFLLVAPLSAHPVEADGLDSSCPYERAAAEAAMGGAMTVTIDSPVPEGSMFSGGHEPSAFLP